jgi:hypothetical protein
MSTVRIQIRRGLASEWTSVDPILAPGEMGLETDTNYIKFGNGEDVWSDLAYAGDNLDQLQSNLDASYVQIADLGQPNGAASLNSSGKVPAAQLDITELAQDAVNNAVTAGTNIVKTYNDTANTLDIALDDSIVLSGDLTVEGASTVEALTVNGNLTVNGTTTTVSTANFTTEDALIYIGEGNSANSVDLGIVGSFNNGTYQHAGLVRDASDGVWKLFSGVVAEPTTVVDFTTHTKDALAVGSLSATGATIGNVSNTEIQYLDGVTSAIQTQLDAKLGTSTASSTYAPINGPTFTGTVSGITKSMVGLGSVDNTSDANKPVSTATETALSLKANLDSPEFAGTVILPVNTSIGSVSSAEIGYLSTVTSNVQDQINAKLTSTTAASTYAPINEPTFTGNVTLPSSTAIGNVTSTEIGYLDGVTSAVQTQLGTAATNLTNHSNATTSVHGIADTSALALKSEISALTKSSVGLGNVDNTSDANKPVSSAQATAIATAKSEAIADATSQVTAVIAGAPGALNTLDELAAALGDDANFASTVTTSLAGKVPSITPIISKTSSYTLSNLSERDSMIEVSSSSATTITIPTNASVAFPVGASIDITQISTGQVTIAGAGGVTVNATPGLKLRTQWSTVTLFKRGTDSWIVYGDLTA